VVARKDVAIAPIIQEILSIARRLAAAMAWKKSPESLRQAFNGAVPNDPSVERRQDPEHQALVGGHLFAMIQNEEMVLRLGPADREALLAFAGAAPYERSPGEFDREYVQVPTSMLGAMDELRAWTTKAFQYGQQLVAMREEEETPPREVFRLVRKQNAVVMSLGDTGPSTTRRAPPPKVKPAPKKAAPKKAAPEKAAPQKKAKKAAPKKKSAKGATKKAAPKKAAPKKKAKKAAPNKKSAKAAPKKAAPNKKAKKAAPKRAKKAAPKKKSAKAAAKKRR
jgi:TfoX/Sxy family transcriptional regulator of competence genes